MDAVIAIGFFLLCGWLVFIVLRFFLRIFVGVFRMGTTPISQQPGAQAQRPVGTGMTAEEEGNVHSGPYGYSPNTAYPETQYGSGFDPDAEWSHEEQ